MTGRTWRSPRAVALAIGAGLIGSLTLAAPALADAPGGAACQYSDGKISGRGSTLQTYALEYLIQSYQSDICGSGAKQGSSDPTDPVDANGNPQPVGSASQKGDWMIAYNYPSAQANSGTGSGQGINAMECRTDAFGGTDLPYAENQLGVSGPFTSTNTNNTIDGPPGTFSSASPPAGNCGSTVAKGNASFTAPFSGITNSSNYPGANDTQGYAMSIPVAGSAVALGYNLPTSCLVSNGAGGFKPLVFTTAEVSDLFGGKISTWNNSELSGGSNSANNANLATCSQNVTRVVRSDNSGTTQNLKNYLKDANGGGTANECDGTAAHNWATLQNQEAVSGTNTAWPSGTGCSPLSAQNGAFGIVSTVANAANTGFIGYADASDWGHAENGGQNVPLAQVQTSTGTFAAPLSGSASNCKFTNALPPQADPNGYVGLDSPYDWALDAANQNVTPRPRAAGDVSWTVQGGDYPICALTWDFVWTGEAGTANEINQGITPPDGKLSADAKRTLYTFFTYVFSDPAQQVLTKVGYASLPESWLAQIRSGFQSNF